MPRASADRTETESDTAHPRDLPRFRNFKTAPLIDRYRFRRPREPWTIADGSFADLEDVLALGPELRLDRPIPTTLHFRFAPGDALLGGERPCDPATIARRLTTGGPFREIVFHAPDAATAARVAALSGIAPHAREGSAGDAATLRCEAFGPIALHVSAFWGAGGSHRVHAAQVRHLVDRGYYVFRVFVDHHPLEEKAEQARNPQLRRECLADAFGHADTLAIRDTSRAAQEQERTLQSLRRSSPVDRLVHILGGAVLLDPNAVAWAGTRAAICVVNHAMHVGLAERITQAPIVLETHDVCAELLNVHGLPHFLPPGADDPALRAQEEQAIWRRVAACVNLAPADHAAVSPHARIAEFVRPVPTRQRPAAIPWPEMAAAHAFPPALAAAGRIDVLLWGSYHKVNVESVTWFLKRVVPADETLAKANIVLAGRMTEPLPAALVKRSGAVALPHVERIEDLFAHAAVLAIPDRSGTGLSIKLMDALAAGRAFAATTAAFRGIDPDDGSYRGCGTAAELAADIGALLRDADRRESRAAMAERLGALNYSEARHREGWDRVLAAVPHTAPRGPCAVAEFQGRLPPGGSPAPDPRISVVVCSYDRRDLLDQCLMSLFDQTAAEDRFEIIVVDNSPDQALAARNAARFAGSRVRYLLEPIVGLSNARNVGTHAARAPLVAFIDDDAIATRNWIETMLDAFARFPDAGAVGGRVLPLWAFARPPWLHENLLGFLTQVDWRGRIRPLREGEWLACANLAFRRQDLLDIGGFAGNLGRRGSDRILLSNEESDVVAQLAARARTLVYAPDCCVEHWTPPQRATPNWIRRRVAWQAVSDFISNAPVASDPAESFARRLEQFHAAHPDAAPGVFQETDDPERFLLETQTAYDAVMVMLLGGADGAARAATDRDRAPRRERRAAPARREPGLVRSLLGRLAGRFRR